MFGKFVKQLYPRNPVFPGDFSVMPIRVIYLLLTEVITCRKKVCVILSDYFGLLCASAQAY